MLVTLFTIAIIITLAICSYFYWIFTYWQRKGFSYLKPAIPFGELQSVIRRKTSMGIAIYDAYRKTVEKMVGIYFFTRPVLLIRDAELAHNILASDFASFHDRGLYVDEKNDPLSTNLFCLKGKSWRTLRNKLSPTFSSGKLKAMFGTMEDISIKMLNYLDAIVQENDNDVELDMRKVLSMYSEKIMESVIFGLEVNDFENASSEFSIFHKKFNQPTLKTVIRNGALFLYPSLEKMLVSLGWIEEAQSFMRDIVKKTIESREKYNIVRRDMLQLLLQLRNTGKINEDDNVWTAETNINALPMMSIDTIAAQMFLFYVAGSDTTASAASFTLYELSQYPDILAKVQCDVEQALLKHDGKLTYEAINDMKYLDLCLMETIRKYPGLPMLNRECTQDYPVPGSDKIIEKGTPIIISLLGIHRDEENFPNALDYNPERFLEDNINYNPTAYMPFGEGPRHCIAQRMGKMNVKIALSQILTHFNVKIRKERSEIEFGNHGITLLPKAGVNVRLSKKRHPKVF